MGIPERANREGDQALPVEGDGDVILELIARQNERILERRKTGIRRYGTPLQRFNGRNVFRDACDEALDLAAYLEQAAGEVEALKLAFLVLAAHARGEKVAPALLEAALDLADKLQCLRRAG
jgi:GNAT superfamily N-acetyltransferase